MRAMAPTRSCSWTSRPRRRHAARSWTWWSGPPSGCSCRSPWAAGCDRPRRCATCSGRAPTRWPSTPPRSATRRCLTRCARTFGRQCVVVSVDARAVADRPGVVGGGGPGWPRGHRPGCHRVDPPRGGAGRWRGAAHVHRPRRHRVRLRPGPAPGRGRRGRRAGRRLGWRGLARGHGGGHHRGACRRGPRGVHLPPRHPLHRHRQGRACRGRRAGPAHRQSWRHDGAVRSLDPPGCALRRQGPGRGRVPGHRRWAGPDGRVAGRRGPRRHAAHAARCTSTPGLGGRLWRKGETSGNVLRRRLREPRL